MEQQAIQVDPTVLVQANKISSVEEFESHNDFDQNGQDKSSTKINKPNGINDNSEKKTCEVANSDINSYKPQFYIDVDYIQQSIENSKRYQYGMVIYFSLTSILCATSLYLTSFLLADPLFHCTNENGQLVGCNEKKFCELNANNQNDPSVRNLINFQYNSWIKEYDQICNYSYIRLLWQSGITLFAALSALLTGVLSDVYGRTKTQYVALISMLILAFLYSFIDNMAAKIAGFIIFGGIQGIHKAQFVYMISESSDSNCQIRQRSLTIYSTFFALGGILVSIISYQVTNANALYIICVVSSLLVIFPMIFLFGDTPKWLYSKGKFEEFFKTVSRISEANGNYHSPEQLKILSKIGENQMIPEPQKEKRCNICCNNIKKICQSKDLRYKVIVLFLMASCFYISYYGLTYNSGLMGAHSLQVNVMITCFVEACTFMILTFFVTFLKRRIGTICCIIAVLIGVLALFLVMFDSSDSKIRQWTETFIVGFFIKICLSVLSYIVYIYGSELFPSSFRGTASGLAQNLGKLMSVMSPLLIELCVGTLKIHPMIGLTVQFPFCLPLVFHMPETLKNLVE